MFSDVTSYITMLGCISIVLLVSFSSAVLQPQQVTVGPYKCYEPARTNLSFEGSASAYFESYVVPDNIYHAIACLKVLLTPQELTIIKSLSEDEIDLFHHGLGMHIRNAWGLWHDSALAKWFGEAGIRSPEEMSSVILRSLHRELNGRPWNWEKSLPELKVNWAEQKAQDLIALCSNIDQTDWFQLDDSFRLRDHPTESNQKVKTYRRILTISAAGKVQNREERCLLRGYVLDLTDKSLSAADRVRLQKLIDDYDARDDPS